MKEKKHPRSSSKSTTNRRTTFSGNHQRSWLWGLHAVTETLATGTWPVHEIFANPKAFELSNELLRSKQACGIPLLIVDSERLQQLTGSSEHQGLAIRLGPFQYQTLASLTTRLSAPPDAASVPLVVICDRLQDGFNMGAILRCCDGANVMAVIVGEHCQADITPHVARSSSGAVNHLAIVQVADLVATVKLLQQQGLQVVAADANKQTSMWSSELTQPTVLIIGSEAQGVQPELLELCDQRLWIPMHGKVSSLNAAVAAGILLYEIRRQQQA
ncbi:MAG: 23S rRNA (guanosine(2251)-2'-O)-methyltransferase RlmB [Pirellulaceae bacterium]